MRFGGHPLHIGPHPFGLGDRKGFGLAITLRLCLGRGKAANIHLPECRGGYEQDR